MLLCEYVNWMWRYTLFTDSYRVCPSHCAHVTPIYISELQSYSSDFFSEKTHCHRCRDLKNERVFWLPRTQPITIKLSLLQHFCFCSSLHHPNIWFLYDVWCSCMCWQVGIVLQNWLYSHLLSIMNPLKEMSLTEMLLLCLTNTTVPLKPKP